MKKFLIVCLGLLAASVVLDLHAMASNGRPMEIVVETGSIHDGETIPLPVFSNGKPATPKQCQWIVTPNSLDIHTPCLFHSTAPIECKADENRVVTCRVSFLGKFGCAEEVRLGTANYLIIATRQPGRETADTPTLSGLKQVYR